MPHFLNKNPIIFDLGNNLKLNTSLAVIVQSKTWIHTKIHFIQKNFLLSYMFSRTYFVWCIEIILLTINSNNAQLDITISIIKSSIFFIFLCCFIFLPLFLNPINSFGWFQKKGIPSQNAFITTNHWSSNSKTI